MSWLSGNQNPQNQDYSQGSQYGQSSQYGMPGNRYGAQGRYGQSSQNGMQGRYGQSSQNGMQSQYGQSSQYEGNQKLPVYYTLDGSLPKTISQMFGETYANSIQEAEQKAQQNLQSKGYTLDYQNPTNINSNNQYEVHFVSGAQNGQSQSWMGGRKKRTRKTKKAKKAKKTKKAKKAKRTRRS
jgi:hypothetical protein